MRPSSALFLLLCSLPAFVGSNSLAWANSGHAQELTVDQAVSLIELSVRHQIQAAHPNGRFSLDPMAIEPDSSFLSYEALGVWRSAPGSAVIGNYSVNLRTAEVWDLSACRVIEFAQLRKLENVTPVNLI